MLEELKQQSLQENGYVMHPYISFVFFRKGDGFCLKHVKQNGMNVGAMKQHLRGKAHSVDPETGNPLNKTNFSQISKEVKNQEDKKSKREVFDYYNHVMTELCKYEDRELAFMIAGRVLDEPYRGDAIFYFNYLKTKEEELKKKMEAEKFFDEESKRYQESVDKNNLRRKLDQNVLYSSSSA